MMCWDAVTLACDSTPELMGYYLILVTLMVPIDAWCPYEEGGEFWCGSYHTMGIPWDIWGSTVSTCVDMASLVPPPGSVWLIDVEAIDVAGNSSLNCAGPPLNGG